MSKVLGSVKFALSYLDDVLVFSKTFAEHLEHLETVLNLLLADGLFVKLKKCQFCKKQFKFLGKIIKEGTIDVDPDKVKAIIQFIRPKNVKSVQRFLGMVGWLRNHIPDFAKIADPLYKVTKKNIPFLWNDKCEEAFNTFKTKLVTPGLALALPDFRRPFFIECDASDTGIGAILVQKDDEGNRKVIEYISRILKGAQLRYTVSEKELLTILYALSKFRGYIGDSQVTIITDHQPLKFLLNIKGENSRLVRWALRLQEFNYIVEYVKGTSNHIPDALSRATNLDEEQSIEELVDMEKILPPSSVSTISISPVAIEVELSNIKNLANLIKEQNSESWIVNIRNKFANGQKVKKNYQMLNNVLCYLKHNSNEEARPIIPSSMIISTIAEFHDSPTAGHFGRAKTLAKLKARVYWHKMEQDVKRYIQECQFCQQVKPPNKCLRPLMQSTTVNEAMELVGVDLMGPYPRSKRQNKFLLVFIDYYSKWIEIYPLKTSNIKVIAKHLLNMWCRFGVPKKISDNGPQFISKVYNTMCRVWGARVGHTTRYHAQSNATERANQVIKHLIQIFVDQDHTEWDKFIPHFAMAMRSSEHATTGFTPAKLFLGREIKMPFDNQLRIDSFTKSTPGMVEKMKELDEEMVNIKTLVEQHMKRHQENQRKYYNQTATLRVFEEGDCVKVRTFNLSDASKNFNAGFQKPWRAPCFIKRKISDLVYEIVDDKGKNLGKYNSIFIDKFVLADRKSEPINALPDPLQSTHTHRYNTRLQAKNQEKEEDDEDKKKEEDDEDNEKEEDDEDD